MILLQVLNDILYQLIVTIFPYLMCYLYLYNTEYISSMCVIYYMPGFYFMIKF